ncbi:MAG: hypothetical protein JNL58_17120 [Planctomyces sp.]|nr:hypothetical protein [Planctomyces sp.]
MSRFVRSLVRFHGEESGNEALQTVAVLATGAIVLVGLLGVWNSDVKTGVGSLIKDLFGTKG